MTSKLWITVKALILSETSALYIPFTFLFSYLRTHLAVVNSVSQMHTRYGNH